MIRLSFMGLLRDLSSTRCWRRRWCIIGIVRLRRPRLDGRMRRIRRRGWLWSRGRGRMRGLGVVQRLRGRVKGLVQGGAGRPCRYESTYLRLTHHLQCRYHPILLCSKTAPQPLPVLNQGSLLAPLGLPTSLGSASSGLTGNFLPSSPFTTLFQR